jgi:large subunit ribosomal protein L10
LAITKDRKDELVADYVELINRSQAIFLTEYTGMSVAKMESLRGEVRKVDGALHVTKNTLLRYALEQTGRPVPEALLNGQVATGFALGEASILAKTLVDYARKDELLKLRGGILGDKLLNAGQVDTLAKLPSLNELRAQLIGIISTPAQNITSAVANGVRQVINVVDAYARKEDGAGTEASVSNEPAAEAVA